MTNQISRDAAAAFHSSQPFKRSNTEVKVNVWSNEGMAYHEVGLYLHGNRIAHMLTDYNIETMQFGTMVFIDTCGWNTVTTRARLNALRGVQVQQRNWILYLNGEEWDGEKIEVNP